MAKFVKIPVVIEAVQLGDDWIYNPEVADLLKRSNSYWRYDQDGLHIPGANKDEMRIAKTDWLILDQNRKLWKASDISFRKEYMPAPAEGEASA